MPCINGDTDTEDSGEEEVGRHCIHPHLAPTPVLSLQEDEEQEVARVDLTRPLCSDYAALGYKCVQFWECGEDGNILDRWILDTVTIQ